MTYTDEITCRRLLSDFGVAPGEQGLNYLQQSFTGDGVTTIFNLSQSPSSLYPVFVYLSGAMQTGGFTIVGTVLTFAVAPGAAVPILTIYSY